MLGALLATWLACAPAPPPRPPPSVLLVTLDTTRADALGSYGGEPGLTPHLDRLAAEGVVFEEAIATAPLTAPAHASMLTGQYPFDHGVRNNLHYVLDDGVPTLAEAFAAEGWSTAAFVSASVLDARIGLARGFEHYGDDVPDDATAPMAVPSIDGADTVDLASTWFHAQVSEAPAQPVLLWVHLYDAHTPYTPAPSFVDRHPDPYLAEVAELDHHVASLQRALRGRDPDRSWVVAVIGDHGEGRGDHGEATHGLLLYRSTLRVPWLLTGPGVPRGQRVAGPVSQVDVPATLASLAGVPWSGGHDLSASWSSPGEPVYAETLVSQESYGLAPMFAVQGDPWKAVLAPRSEGYDWRRDPGEQAPHTVPTQAAAWLAAHPGAGERPGPTSTAAQLEALGYLAGVPGGLVEPTRDPKDHRDLPSVVAETIYRAHQVPPAEGAELIADLLTEHPGVLQLHGELAMAHGAAGEAERGLAVLDELPLTQDHPYVASRRAALLEQLGRAAEAGEVLADAHRISPHHAGLATRYATHLHGRGHHEKALEVLTAADTSGRSLSALVLRGRLALALGRPDEAVSPLQQALSVDPNHPETLRLLAPTAATLGWDEEAAALARHALTVDPDATWALALAGRLAWARGGCPAAAPHLARLRDLATPPPEAAGLLADCPDGH